MSAPERSAIEQAIAGYEGSDLDTDLVTAGCIEDVSIDGGGVTVSLRLGYPADTVREAMAEALRERIETVEDVESATVRIESSIGVAKVQTDAQRIENIGNIIAVASAKGGVGKSTTAANLALALRAEGARVGMLDADIYGPSQPRMLGIQGKPDTVGDKYMKPKTGHGIAAMSIGFLVDPESPMIWRGPMVTQALEQMLYHTQWPPLDYLIVDLPPGTGDIQLTLAQKVPLAGAIIVTTPQEIALLDARKGLKMFEKVSVPILGIVENMSLHVCSNCGHEEPIFGSGGGERMAADYDVRLLGQLPLELSIRTRADGGEPTVVSDPDSAAAERYRRIARRAAAGLSAESALPQGFPSIRIVDD